MEMSRGPWEAPLVAVRGSQLGDVDWRLLPTSTRSDISVILPTFLSRVIKKLPAEAWLLFPESCSGNTQQSSGLFPGPG